MRVVELSKGVGSKLKNGSNELKLVDLNQSVKSFTPGEWCVFKSEDNDFWIGFINPILDKKYNCINILQAVSKSESASFKPEIFLRNKIELAINRRRIFVEYQSGSRLIYGQSDYLPGLIVDKLKNICLIQINNAGLDQFRDLIKSILSEVLNCDCYFLDNPKYREKEGLPSYSQIQIPDLEIEENGLKYFLDAKVLQKVGFYYDHRQNRLYLKDLLSKVNLNFKLGVDLFCYAGAWGMNALHAGVERMDFIDQGNFSGVVERNLNLNGFKNRGLFFRKDVFSFLDECLSEGKKYDVILCDPPAFAKNIAQKKDALDGYTKLHRKVFKLAKEKSICVFSSCTHYVSFDEFEQNIWDASKKEKKKIQLLHTGIQGWDHPISTIKEKSNYIKSLFYLVE